MTIPSPKNPLNYLTEEPFRWDQRVFSLVLGFPSISRIKEEPRGEISKNDRKILSSIGPICAVTGGFCKIVKDMNSLTSGIVEITKKLNTIGVIVNFKLMEHKFRSNESLLLKPSDINSPHCLLKCPRGKKNNGLWPIPENFFPTNTMNSLVCSYHLFTYDDDVNFFIIAKKKISTYYICAE